MILPPVPLVLSLKLYAATLFALLLIVALGFRSWLRRRALRVGAASFLTFLLAAHAAWAVGMRNPTVSYWGALAATVVLPMLVLLTASLPLSALARRRSRPKNAAPSGPTRRAVLQGVAAAIPMAAMGTGLAGWVGGAAEPRLRVLPMTLPRLPPALAGLRILQLSDLHLGCSKGIDTLERLLANIGASDRPDLIVLTGDVAEDQALLGPALRLVEQFRPRLGVFSALGNHEYLRGIRTVRAAYEKSAVSLLINRSEISRVGDSRLVISGVDDPVFVHRAIEPVVEPWFDRALDGTPSDAFRMMLSHRPEGFNLAAPRGVDLTLSGHTHGGQIGFNGKSAFQALYPDGYLWGAYRRGDSALYTTCGFGAWYPFRLGAPPEAPLIVLQGQPALAVSQKRVQPVHV